jgi:hypothetical protein
LPFSAISARNCPLPPFLADDRKPRRPNTRPISGCARTAARAIAGKKNPGGGGGERDGPRGRITKPRDRFEARVDAKAAAISPIAEIGKSSRPQLFAKIAAWSSGRRPHAVDRPTPSASRDRSRRGPARPGWGNEAQT